MARFDLGQKSIRNYNSVNKVSWMMRLIDYRSVLMVLTAVCLLAWPGVSFAQSDDDDTVPMSSDDADTVQTGNDAQRGPTREKAEQLDQKVFRIGVLEMRPTFEVEQKIEASKRELLTRAVTEETKEINAFNNTVIPHEEIVKTMGPRELVLYNRCWLDPGCLQVALKPASLDILIAGKVRMSAVDPSTLTEGGMAPSMGTNPIGAAPKEQMFAEFTLFVRIIDLPNRRVLKEILVTQTSMERLAEVGQQEYHKSLIELGLITEVPVLMTSPSNSDDMALLYEDLPQPQLERNPGVGIAAWTTLATGVVAEGLGLVFGYLSNKEQSNADKAASIPELKDYNDKSRTYMITSNAMYGTGGALLLTSVILFIVDWQNAKNIGAGGGIGITDDGVLLKADVEF